jgi:PAS domain S-box-containing protein
VGPVVYTNVVIEGMLAFAALHYFLLWWRSRRERVLLIFSIFAAIVSAVIAITVSVVTANSIESAQTALNLRTTFGVLAYPLLLWLVCEIASVPPGRLVKGLTIVFALVAAASAFGVRINGTVTGLDQIQMPWGEVLNVVERDGRGYWAGPVYFLLLSVQGLALHIGWRAWRRDRLASLLIVITGIVTVLGTIPPVLADVARLPVPYIGILQFVIWIPVLSVLLSREHARRDERLAATQSRYRTLIESAPEAIVVLDLGMGRFVEHNQKAVDMFGWPADELANMSPVDISPEFQPDGRRSSDAAAEYLRQAVAEGTAFFEWTHRSRDGRDIPCEIRLARLPDPSRILVRGSIADITDRLQLEAQLRQAQKMEAIGQLAGGVAHDFNNLLTVIAGYCGILLDRLPPDDPLRSDVRAIADAGHRAASLTQRLLAFSRRAVLTPKVIDVNSVVRETEQILRRLIGEDILLTVALLPGGGLVKVDPGHLGQVLINLAVNARDALPNGGGLTIRTERVDLGSPVTVGGQEMPAGHYVRLVVSDTGHGMTADVKSRIFEPFFTTKGVGKGTGLGLAVVHGFVKQSGGYIEVDSVEGKGSTFSISLPLIEESHAVVPVTPADVTARGAETILLVEDEEAVRHLLARGLRNYGFTVMTASDGAEALRLVHDRTPHIDLLATDVVMPNMSGRDLADRLRKERAGLKVLFMSGYTDDTLLRHGVYEQREAFLQKPFALQAFASKVREILDQQ